MFRTLPPPPPDVRERDVLATVDFVLARADDEILASPATVVRQLTGMLEALPPEVEASSAVLEAKVRLQGWLETGHRLLAARAEQAQNLTRRNRELDRQKRQLDAAVRRLLRVDHARAHLLAMAAHDLKTPLAAILALAEQLGRDGPGAGPGGAAPASRIRDIARTSLDLVTQLLASRTIEAGRRPLVPARVEAAALLQAVAAELSTSAAAKQICLHCAPADGPAAGDAVAWADPLALRQIVGNLAANAVAFTPPGGSVALAAAATARRVRITISDTGPGFTAGDRRRMFAPGAQLSARPTGGESSTGLGLHLVLRLVEESRGRITCRSRPGQGACFEVTLPRAKTS